MERVTVPTGLTYPDRASAFERDHERVFARYSVDRIESNVAAF